MDGERDYYVYVYIDPRDHEEFYYGKGKGKRKTAHLKDNADSEKVRRIAAIKKEGLAPIIKVIAAELTEFEAHLIEATLIWRLGRNLTNRAAGKYSRLFRPHKTLHKDLPGFDSRNHIYYFNVGEGPHRNWNDCMRLGFVSAGGGKNWIRQIRDGLSAGDIVIPYLKKHGFVGVGKVLSAPRPYHQFVVQGKQLHSYNLQARMMDEFAEDPDRCEWPTAIKWIRAVPREAAKWKRNAGLFTTQLVKASLENQPSTLRYVEKEFDVDLKKLLK